MKCIIVKNITSRIRTVCGIKLDKNQSCNLGEYSDSKLQLIRVLQAAGLHVSLEDFNETLYNPTYSKEPKVVAPEEPKVVVKKSEKAEEPKVVALEEPKVVAQKSRKTTKEAEQSNKAETTTEKSKSDDKKNK